MLSLRDHSKVHSMSHHASVFSGRVAAVRDQAFRITIPYRRATLDAFLGSRLEKDWNRDQGIR